MYFRYYCGAARQFNVTVKKGSPPVQRSSQTMTCQWNTSWTPTATLGVGQTFAQCIICPVFCILSDLKCTHRFVTGLPVYVPLSRRQRPSWWLLAGSELLSPLMELWLTFVPEEHGFKLTQQWRNWPILVRYCTQGMMYEWCLRNNRG